MHDASKYPARRRVFAATNLVLLLLCVMYLLTYIDRVNVSTASNVFEKELNLNKTQVGFIFYQTDVRRRVRVGIEGTYDDKNRTRA
jgi:hypothetical protein